MRKLRFVKEHPAPNIDMVTIFCIEEDWAIAMVFDAASANSRLGDVTAPQGLPLVRVWERALITVAGSLPGTVHIALSMSDLDNGEPWKVSGAY